MPWTGSQGETVSVGTPSGPGRKHGTPPQFVVHEGLTYSMRLISPSPSGSPLAPSALEALVALRPLAASQPSGIPSPSVSHPFGSSSATPSPSSSLDEQSASPSLSESEPSTCPSLSSSKPFAQTFPTGSSSQRMVLPWPSLPVSPQSGWLNCIESSSFQSLTGMVPFHQTPLSKTPVVAGLSQFEGCR